jgi:hypothetical protein
VARHNVQRTPRITQLAGSCGPMAEISPCLGSLVGIICIQVKTADGFGSSQKLRLRRGKKIWSEDPSRIRRTIFPTSSEECTRCRCLDIVDWSWTFPIEVWSRMLGEVPDQIRRLESHRKTSHNSQPSGSTSSPDVARLEK